MKRVFRTAILGIIAVFLVGGCVRHNTTMEIKNDKSVSLEIIYAMDTTALESMNSSNDGLISTSDSSIKKEKYNFLISKGFSVEEYESKDGDANYKGVKISKTFNNIDDITSDHEEKVDLVQVFDEDYQGDINKVNFFYKNGDKYVSNFYFNYVAQEGADANMGALANSMDLKYKVTLPSVAKSNNATSVNDKVYTWDLKYGQKNDIDFSFTFGGSNMTMILTIAGVVFVVGVILLIIVLTRTKKQ